jgi:[calcium/calmodulin-dependent protein kinase] kinase
MQLIIRIRREIAIFKKVHHPNVVRMKEIIDDPEQSKLFMIMEYCEGGEIKWQDGQERPALTVAETRRIFRETLLGLEYRRFFSYCSMTTLITQRVQTDL